METIPVIDVFYSVGGNTNESMIFHAGILNIETVSGRECKLKKHLNPKTILVSFAKIVIVCKNRALKAK